jgi:outer membrane protein OmpA-like peptidoglycan-associated protein
LNNIFFDFDSDELNNKSLNELNKIVQFLQQHPKVAIEVAGYTDEVGSSAYNLGLSERRAKAVYSALLKKGIADARLNFKGYGSIPQNDGSFQKIVVIKIIKY